MARFVIEHLPRMSARYDATPLAYGEAQVWVQQPGLTSLVRTTELISAIDIGMGIVLSQSDQSMTLQPGDEALLIGLSFGVLLAWAQGKIPPVAEDWRFVLLALTRPSEAPPVRALEIGLAEEPSV